MLQDDFNKIFNKHFHFTYIPNTPVNKEKLVDLQKKIITEITKPSNRNRFLSTFRLANSKDKLSQFFLTKNEIKLGDAFEEVTKAYLIENDFKVLNGRVLSQEGNFLDIDLYFKKNDIIYVLEQKIRDDHDTTKKAGQVSNLIRKYNSVVNLSGDNLVYTGFFFVDPLFVKNKLFYENSLSEITNNYKVFYGKDLFDKLEISKSWVELISYFEDWKINNSISNVYNFDKTPDISHIALKSMSKVKLRNIFSNDDIVHFLSETLFPDGSTYKMLLASSKDPVIIAKIIQILEKYYTV